MIVYLVGVEVGGAISISSRSWRRVSCNVGFRQRAGAGLQDVGDVLGAEGLEGEPVGDGTRHRIGGIDLGQRQNLANVLAALSLRCSRPS